MPFTMTHLAVYLYSLTLTLVPILFTPILYLRLPFPRTLLYHLPVTLALYPHSYTPIHPYSYSVHVAFYPYPLPLPFTMYPYMLPVPLYPCPHILTYSFTICSIALLVTISLYHTLTFYPYALTPFALTHLPVPVYPILLYPYTLLPLPVYANSVTLTLYPYFIPHTL